MVLSIYLMLCMHFVGSLVATVDIPDIINDYCPYTEFCDRKPRTIDSSEEKSCCVSCACDPECGLRQNCCFDELDSYKLFESGAVGCYSTVLGSTSMRTDKYYMINSCNFEGIIGKGKDRAEQIADNSCMYNENGHMFFQPVSSTGSGWIYVNSKCAKCNWEFNHKAWDYFSSGSLLIGNAETGKTDSELKYFSPPFGEDWSKHLCLTNINDFITNCSESSRWYSLCNNLYAPFRTDKSELWFRNVFCAVCMGLPIMENCKPEKSTDLNSFSSLTLLFNTSVIEMSRSANKPEDCSYRTLSHQQSICLRVLCPEGMANTPAGCMYYVLLWNVYNYVVQIRLIPAKENNLTIEPFQHLNDSERLYPLSWLKAPCASDPPYTTVVYYEINENLGDNIKSVIVQLFGNRRWANLKKVVSELHQCIDQQWIIMINTEKHVFNASFDKYSGYIQDGIQKLQKVSYTNITEEEEMARPKKYEMITNTYPKIYSMLNKIGKLFFCPQVHLTREEVEIGFGEIRILTSNVTLGNNEFAVKDTVLFSETADKVFAVCLDDYAQRNKAGFDELVLDPIALLIYCISFSFIFI